MATLDVKFTKFDNRPWGFRLAGGSDFPEPLTVIKVTEGSLAECMGLKVGDVVVKLNDQNVSDLTHGQAHEALVLAGNNFVLGVRRTEDPFKAIEGIEEKIEPYMLPIEKILFDPLEESQRGATPDEVSEIKDESVLPPDPESEKVETEVYPEKPKDENSEKIANTNLTDEEIAQLILDEEEVLNEKGVLGVNFKKIRPRAPLFKQSAVFKELVKEELVKEEPAQAQQLKRQTTFLQRPERAPPKPRASSQSESEASKPSGTGEQSEPEPYRVVIKKQPPKKSVTERLLERGLLDPARLVKTPSPSEKPSPAATPEPNAQAPSSDVGSRPQSRAEVVEITDSTDAANETQGDTQEQEQTQPEPKIEEPSEEDPGQPAQLTLRRPSAEVDVEVEVTMDRDKIKELVTTEISLERQLESVQSQLLALKQLPSEIEKHLQIVSQQLHKIMELSGAQPQQQEQQQQQQQTDASQAEGQQEELVCRREQRPREDDDEVDNGDERHRREQEAEALECSRPSQRLDDAREDSRRDEELQQAMSDAEADESSSWAPHLISTDPDFSITESKELEISVKSNEDDGKRVKKYIVSYESKVIQEAQEAQRTRTPSPACSHRSFEVDPNLTLQDQLVQELKHRKGRKRGPRDHLWQPQARQLELTYGRKWRCPNDFFNDDMIADVLSSQAEVIRGRALGVNFKKFEKTALPNYDHLMNSSVYKMIHKMEVEPKKGIPARPPKVAAAEDIIERVNTPVCCMANC